MLKPDYQNVAAKITISKNYVDAEIGSTKYHIRMSAVHKNSWCSKANGENALSPLQIASRTKTATTNSIFIHASLILLLRNGPLLNRRCVFL